MTAPTLLRRLPFLAATVLTVALLHRAGSRLVAGPADARELLALVGPGAMSSRASWAVLVFQIVDCAESRDELAAWSHAMAASAPDLSSRRAGRTVVGVMVGPLPDDGALTRRILDEAGLDFPVRHDESGRVASFVQALGYRMTPVALLLDGRGRLERAGAPGSLFLPDGVIPGADSVPGGPYPTEGPS